SVPGMSMFVTQYYFRFLLYFSINSTFQRIQILRNTPGQFVTVSGKFNAVDYFSRCLKLNICLPSENFAYSTCNGVLAVLWQFERTLHEKGCINRFASLRKAFTFLFL